VIALLIIRTAVKSSYWENGGIYWQHCLDEKPEHMFALIKKGMYHYYRYEIDPSLKALNKAVELAPDDYETNYSRGVVYLGAMLLPEATRDFRKALTLDTASSNAYFGIGSIHSLYSRYDSAVIAYTEAIRYSPKFYEAYTNRGTVYGGMGKYVQSFADYHQAQKINPNFGQLYGNRALISLQIGNAQSAGVDFAAQIALEPNQVTPRIHAAFTSILLGDTTAAIFQFSKAREIDSLRTKLYLTTAFETFLKTKQEIALGNRILKQSIGHY
jgi:tetratricopeptide (TPR) repeat protein